MSKRQHTLFNLQWRLRAMQSAVEALVHEITKLLAEEASKGEQGGGNGNN